MRFCSSRVEDIPFCGLPHVDSTHRIHAHTHQYSEGVLKIYVGFLQIRGTFLLGPHSKDYSILESILSILGSPYFGKPPCMYMYMYMYMYMLSHIQPTMKPSLTEIRDSGARLCPCLFCRLWASTPGASGRWPCPSEGLSQSE